MALNRVLEYLLYTLMETITKLLECSAIILGVIYLFFRLVGVIGLFE